MNFIIFSPFIKLTASIFKDFIHILIINDNNNNNLYFQDYNLYKLTVLQKVYVPRTKRERNNNYDINK